MTSSPNRRAKRSVIISLTRQELHIRSQVEIFRSAMSLASCHLCLGISGCSIFLAQHRFGRLVYLHWSILRFQAMLFFTDFLTAALPAKCVSYACPPSITLHSYLLSTSRHASSGTFGVSHDVARMKPSKLVMPQQKPCARNQPCKLQTRHHDVYDHAFNSNWNWPVFRF